MTKQTYYRVDLQYGKKIKFLRISPHNNNFNQTKIVVLIKQKRPKIIVLINKTKKAHEAK